MEFIEGIKNSDDMQIDFEGCSRNSLVILSCINSKIFSHIISSKENLKSLSNLHISESINRNNQDTVSLIDVNVLTKTKSIDEITLLIFESIFKVGSIYFKIVERSWSRLNSEQSGSDSQIDNNIDDFGLFERKKNQKLTHQQIIFIR